MDVEMVVWGLVALGVVLAALLAVIALRHVRRLARVRATVSADVARRVARLQLLAAARAHRKG
jgi:hypothetical protein